MRSGQLHDPPDGCIDDRTEWLRAPLVWRFERLAAILREAEIREREGPVATIARWTTFGSV